MGDCIASGREILGNEGLHREEVHIKAWGKSIWLRELTLTERLAFEQQQFSDSESKTQDRQNPGERVRKESKANKNIDFFVRLLLVCAETPNREPLFSADDLEALRHSSAAAIYEGGMAALRISRLRPDDIDNLKKS